MQTEQTGKQANRGTVLLFVFGRYKQRKQRNRLRLFTRIDKIIFVGPPDEEARKALLEMYLYNRPVVRGFDLLNLSKKLEGYSCSDIKNLVDEAARLAVREKASDINELYFLKAIKRNPPGVDCSVLAKYAKFKGRGGA